MYTAGLKYFIMADKKKVSQSTKSISHGEEPTEIFSDTSQNNQPRFSDYFNFTESYTSLILGIVVVIIASVLLVSFFQNRRMGNFKKVRQDISATNTVDKSKLNLPTATISAALAQDIQPTTVPESSPTPKSENTVISITPPNAPLTISPTRAAMPTVSATATTSPMPTLTKTPTLTLAPTKQPTITPLATKEPSPTVVPTKAMAQSQTSSGKYIVTAGESLWSIAEKTYNDGYKWTEIAKANNLSNPNVIESNQALLLPKLDTKAIAQDTSKNDNQMNAPNTQTPATYTVVKGDDLWDIAVKVYNDGYKWTEIAKANNLVHPNTIHSGNVLTIPR